MNMSIAWRKGSLSAPCSSSLAHNTPLGHLATSNATDCTYLVLDIDVQGARQLKAKIPEAVTVFILARSRLVLEQRLRARSEDREDVIARRIMEARPKRSAGTKITTMF
jgi:guanylate kinase